MLKPAKIFLLIATAVFGCSSVASAAIFEIGRPLSGASGTEFRLLPGSGTEGLYQRARIQYAAEQKFSPLNALAANPEDLLWIAIADAGLLGLKASTFAAHPPSYLIEFETDRASVHRTGQAGASNVPTERTAPKIWVLFMIGAGLIWFQLRRKARHHTIRFTVP